MSSPGSLGLQGLHCLDRSQPEFAAQLSKTLYGEKYKRCVPTLDDADSVWLVDYLDDVLGTIGPLSPAFRKCLRELRYICGARSILPTSYTISPPSQLLDIGLHPFAQGGFGDVHEGTLDGSRVCVKRVRIYTQDTNRSAKTFCQEAVMWKHLVHPNILPLLGATVTPLQLISDWMPGGDLPNYIRKNPNVDRLGLLFGVAKGLRYLHSCNVIHGDLKGPNVLVDDSGHPRIADFGLTTVAQGLDSTWSATPQRAHTARWTAPEVLNGGKYTKEADIFSFAMVIIEIFTGAVPFSGCPSVTAMFSITQGKRPPRPIHPTFTEDLWNLTQRCWDPNPISRPKTSDVALQVLTLSVCGHLIGEAPATHERIPLIAAIFLDDDQAGVPGQVSEENAQTLIDVIDKVLDNLAPETCRRCMCYLQNICGHRTLLPRSLAIPPCYNPTENALCHGGFGDVWKGQHHGKDVAVKVLRIYSANDFEIVKKRFCREVVTWKGLHHPNVQSLLGATMSENRFVIVSEWMENGNINEFVKKHTGEVNWLGLLGDAARGLKYMHDQGMIHGNLRGANVLVDSNRHARLADFGLLTITPAESAATSTGATTAQWMSPELLLPDKFGLKESNPTEASDCYALGMVIYEVLSGRTPFAQHSFLTVAWKVANGEHPERPQGVKGAQFTDDVWGMLELCWKFQPGDRMSSEEILLVLEGNPCPSYPSAKLGGGVGAGTDDSRTMITSDSDELPDPTEPNNLGGGW